MATRPRELSNKAKWVLTQSLETLEQANDAIREAHEQNIKGDTMKVNILLGDVLRANVMVHQLLYGASVGDYHLVYRIEGE